LVALLNMEGDQSECSGIPHLLHPKLNRTIYGGLVYSVSEKSFFPCMNRNMQPKIHRSATTYSVQNSISDTLYTCRRICRQGLESDIAFGLRFVSKYRNEKKGKSAANLRERG
jgi:hypothetical protein